MDMQSLKNFDLSSLDINDISHWPLPFKIIAMMFVSVVIIAGGYWFIIKDKIAEREVVQRKEMVLKDTFLKKKAQAINLPAYKTQMAEMQETFGGLLRQLPDKTEVDALLVDITQAGLGRGLKFVLFRPENELQRDFYAELPITLTVTGSYHELANFISDVSSLPRIVTFDNIGIKQAGDTLEMGAKAKTYRYIDITKQ